MIVIVSPLPHDIAPGTATSVRLSPVLHGAEQGVTSRMESSDCSHVMLMAHYWHKCQKQNSRRNLKKKVSKHLSNMNSQYHRSYCEFQSCYKNILRPASRWTGGMSDCLLKRLTSVSWRRLYQTRGSCSARIPDLLMGGT